MDIDLIQQQCDFENIDEMNGQQDFMQPREFKHHDNGIQNANQREFFSKLKQEL